MINKESVRYTFNNLKHRKGRSFLTIFSIFVGIATIFVFISFGLGLYNYVEEVSTGSSADKILITAKGSNFGLDTSFVLDEKDVKAVLKSSGVKDATGLYVKTVEIEKGSERIYSFLISYDPKKTFVLEMFNIGINEGRVLNPGEKGVAVMGYNYKVDGEIFSKRLEINDLIEIEGEKIRVVGFLEKVGNPQDDSQIYVSNSYFESLYPEIESYAEIVAVVEIESMKESINDIERNLRKSRNLEKGKEDFFVQSFEELIETFSSVLNIIVGFVILIALISVLVSAINTANTMITSVLERYKEIGVLKAIGARNSEIFSIFLFESSLLGFVAGILGVFFGWILSSIGKKILVDLGYSFLSPSFTWELFLGCILFATLTGAISGVLPAIRASKINTVDALRYE